MKIFILACCLLGLSIASPLEHLINDIEEDAKELQARADEPPCNGPCMGSISMNVSCIYGPKKIEELLDECRAFRCPSGYRKVATTDVLKYLDITYENKNDQTNTRHPLPSEINDQGTNKIDLNDELDTSANNIIRIIPKAAYEGKAKIRMACFTARYIKAFSIKDKQDGNVNRKEDVCMNFAREDFLNTGCSPMKKNLGPSDFVEARNIRVNLIRASQYLPPRLNSMLVELCIKN